MWNKVPKDPNDLPWEVKAGKRLLWSITIKAHSGFPEANFVMAGSFVQLVKDNMDPKYCVVRDKQLGDGGYYYHTVTAYQDCPAAYTLKS